VVGCIPPDVLEKLTDVTSGEDGFLARILFCWPELTPERWSDYETPEDVQAAYAAFFQRLYALREGSSTPLVLRPTSSAKALVKDYVTRLGEEMADPDFPASLKGAWGKFEGYLPRLALITHVCRQVSGETENEEVDEGSVHRAIDLCDYFKANARRVYPRLTTGTTTEQEQDVTAVLDWIKNPDRKHWAEDPPRFSWNDIRKSLHNRFKDRDKALEIALDKLEGRNLIRETENQKLRQTGRPRKPAYLINPYVRVMKVTKPETLVAA
jgi:hypothetical protein